MFNLIEIKKKNVCIMGLMGSGKSIILDAISILL
ncbi:MAG: ATP-binding protein, partial [Fusobacterium sp.]